MERNSNTRLGRMALRILRGGEPWVEEADPKYRHLMVAMLILRLQKGGRKSVSRRIVYGAMSRLKRRFPFKKPIDVVSAAVAALRRAHEVCRRRSKEGDHEPFAAPVPRERATILAVRELADKARKAKGKSMSERLADQIAEVYLSTVKEPPPGPRRAAARARVG
jgi:small subunit ribosomal protein S7